MFSTSGLPCIDESINRWYGQGVNGFMNGFPSTWLLIVKPENGCEIQNSACGKSGVMFRLKHVRTAE